MKTQNTETPLSAHPKHSL